MKTIRMPHTQRSLHGSGSRKDNSEVIDDFAQQVLQRHAPDSSVESSLGSYVTSVLRTTDLTDLTSIDEYEGLIELIQEHCNIEETSAKEALEEIGRAVETGVVPTESPFSSSGGLFSSAEGLSSMVNMTAALPSDTDDFPPLGSEPNVTSPIHADKLLPGDLLGEFDVPTPHLELQTADATDEFPPLGSVPVSDRKNQKTKDGASSSAEIAAALFRPSSSRSQSIDESATSQQSSSTPPTMTQPLGYSAASQSTDPVYSHQAWASTVDILMSMNMGLGEEPASAAATMANADVNVAQYIVDQASSAPQVCRHLLKDGCYRSDCTFSHDVDGHTCVFWLKGRCGKGEECRFLHGFSEKLLEGVAEIQAQSAPYDPYQGGYEEASTTYGTDGYNNNFGWVPEQTSSAPSSFANIAFQGYRPSDFTDPSTSSMKNNSPQLRPLGTVRIPQDLWNPNENRDSSVFHIADPMERYYSVSATSRRPDVIDLHYQSIKTFPVVLETILNRLLRQYNEVWVVTGTGHHVGSRTHQKGGGALEIAVQDWLSTNGYFFSRGKDRNGEGGAVLVKQ